MAAIRSDHAALQAAQPENPDQLEEEEEEWCARDAPPAPSAPLIRLWADVCALGTCGTAEFLGELAAWEPAAILALAASCPAGRKMYGVRVDEKTKRAIHVDPMRLARLLCMMVDVHTKHQIASFFELARERLVPFLRRRGDVESAAAKKLPWGAFVQRLVPSGAEGVSGDKALWFFNAWVVGRVATERGAKKLLGREHVVHCSDYGQDGNVARRVLQETHNLVSEQRLAAADADGLQWLFQALMATLNTPFVYFMNATGKAAPNRCVAHGINCFEDLVWTIEQMDGGAEEFWKGCPFAEGTISAKTLAVCSADQLYHKFHDASWWVPWAEATA